MTGQGFAICLSGMNECRPKIFEIPKMPSFVFIDVQSHHYHYRDAPTWFNKGIQIGDINGLQKKKP